MRAPAHRSCLHCGRVVFPPFPRGCPRCGAALHARKPHSLQRTAALLGAAAILFVPANLLPVMRVWNLGREQSDTILGGVGVFLESGSWGLALLIFVASILVPTFKLAILGYLVISVRQGTRRQALERARLFRLTEVVGRWSMVDIYVVTMMVAMVELGRVASIAPGPGALAFALVVVCTMLAAHTFDPRLIWDALETGHDGA